MVYGIVKINLGNPHFALQKSNVCSVMYLTAQLIFKFFTLIPKTFKIFGMSSNRLTK